MIKKKHKTPVQIFFITELYPHYFYVIDIKFCSSLLQKVYEDMENRIENATKLGQVPSEIRSKHKGFTHWDSYSSPRDHDAIVQVCYIYSPSRTIFFLGDDPKFKSSYP